jgi:hypothetical protein
MGRLRRRAVLGLTLLWLPACARDLVAENGGWRSLRDGYWIGSPGPEWRRVELDGAALAFRQGDQGSLSLQARCGRPLADPAILARQLVIGIPERTLREAAPSSVAGLPAWTQTFDARLDGRTLRTKSVTLVAGACAYDLVLVAGEDFGPSERSFDAWVRSFSPPGVASAGGSP